VGRQSIKIKTRSKSDGTLHGHIYQTQKSVVKDQISPKNINPGHLYLKQGYKTRTNSTAVNIKSSNNDSKENSRGAIFRISEKAGFMSSIHDSGQILANRNV
jgi:hypothetical protein